MRHEELCHTSKEVPLTLDLVAYGWVCGVTSGCQISCNVGTLVVTILSD